MAIDPPVIGFRAADMGRAGIEMHADENGVAKAVGADHAIIEIDEGVVAPHEDGAEISAEFGADSFGHIEREVFFLLAGVTADGPGIGTAVAGIDDHGFEPLGAGAVAPDIAPGGGAHGPGAGRQKGGEREAEGGFAEQRHAGVISGLQAEGKPGIRGISGRCRP